MRRLAPRRFESAARAGLALLAIVCGLVAGASAPDEAKRARLAHDNVRLRNQLDLAKEKSTYLALDLEGRRLRLMNGGAVLRDYPILEAEIGTPTVLFVNADRPVEHLGDAVRTGAHVEPRRRVGRIEMVPSGSPDEPADIPVPAEPEEALPAPDRYVLRYDDGFTIEVRTAASSRSGGFWSGFVSGLRGRLLDAAAIVSGARAPRVRLVLDAADAGALYRSFPVESKLLVL